MARYTHATDQKGRMILPAKLRENLGSAVYVTSSLDNGYLAIYTTRQFLEIKEQLDLLPGTDPVARRLRRSIIGEALLAPLDGQGRISISDELWQSIQVAPGDNVCLLDMGESLQVCSEKFYLAERAEEIPLSELQLSSYNIRGIL